MLYCVILTIPPTKGGWITAYLDEKLSSRWAHVHLNEEKKKLFIKEGVSPLRKSGEDVYHIDVPLETFKKIVEG